MRRTILPVILLLSGVVSTPAFAADEPSAADIKRAAESYDQGRERFREGQFTEAAEKFESADDSAPSAAALRLAIFARKEAGQVDRALTHAALALELYPNNDELRAEAQAVIDEAGAGFGTVRVDCDEPCELLLNNRIVHGAAATSRLVYVTPGSAEVRASWSDGRTESEDITVEQGGSQEISFIAPPMPTAPTDGSSDYGSAEEPGADGSKRDGWHPAVFWTGLTLTGVGLGASFALGLNAKNNPGVDAVRQNCTARDESCPEWKEGKRNERMVNIALGTTAALGIFTITSAFLTDFGGTEEVSYQRGNLSIRPTFAVGDGALLGALGTF